MPETKPDSEHIATVSCLLMLANSSLLSGYLENGSAMSASHRVAMTLFLSSMGRKAISHATCEGIPLKRYGNNSNLSLT
jgi:hypothetical protein